MAITYDPAKRAWTLRERGLDFEDAQEVFGGRVYQQRDDRRDYGEIRFISVGFLRGRTVIVDASRQQSARHIDEQGQ